MPGSFLPGFTARRLGLPTETTPLLSVVGSSVQTPPAMTVAGALEDYLGHSHLSVQSNRIYALSLIFAFLSGVLYWSSATSGAERYAKYFHWPDFVYVGAFFGFMTNMLFNIESYATLIDEAKHRRSESEKFLTGQRTLFNYWFWASVISAVTVVPVAYMVLRPDSIEQEETGFSFFSIRMLIALNVISAILNVPIHIDGSIDLFYRWRRYKASKNSVHHKARDVIIEKLEARMHEVSRMDGVQWVGAQQQLVAGNYCESLGAWLSVPMTPPPNPAYHPPVSATFFVHKILLPILAFCVLYQNLGFGVESYLAGAKGLDSKFLGWLIAIAETLPSVGFSLKGIETLRDRLEDLMHRRKSLMQTSHPKTYIALISFALLFAVGSGFTGDQVNYEGWKFWPDLGGDMWAKISGVIGNIGIAIPYNAAECLDLARRCIEVYLIKTQPEDSVVKQKLALMKRIKDFIRLFQQFSDERLEAFFQDTGLPQDAIRDVLNASRLADKVDLIYPAQLLAVAMAP